MKRFAGIAVSLLFLVSGIVTGCSSPEKTAEEKVKTVRKDQYNLTVEELSRANGYARAVFDKTYATNSEARPKVNGTFISCKGTDGGSGSVINQLVGCSGNVPDINSGQLEIKTIYCRYLKDGAIGCQDTDDNVR
jgi:hypothetical protein